MESSVSDTEAYRSFSVRADTGYVSDVVNVWTQ